MDAGLPTAKTRATRLKTIQTRAVLIVTGCVAGYLLAGLGARLLWGPATNHLIAVAILASVLPLFLLMLFLPRQADSAIQKNGGAELAEALLHSTSPMILATALDGSFTYMTPSAERILGIRATDLVGKARMTEVFASGEMERISQWLRKLHPSAANGPAAADPRFTTGTKPKPPSSAKLTPTTGIT